MKRKLHCLVPEQQRQQQRVSQNNDLRIRSYVYKNGKALFTNNEAAFYKLWFSRQEKKLHLTKGKKDPAKTIEELREKKNSNGC